MLLSFADSKQSTVLYRTVQPAPGESRKTAPLQSTSCVALVSATEIVRILGKKNCIKKMVLVCFARCCCLWFVPGAEQVVVPLWKMRDDSVGPIDLHRPALQGKLLLSLKGRVGFDCRKNHRTNAQPVGKGRRNGGRRRNVQAVPGRFVVFVRNRRRRFLASPEFLPDGACPAGPPRPQESHGVAKVARGAGFGIVVVDARGNVVFVVLFVVLFAAEPGPAFPLLPQGLHLREHWPDAAVGPSSGAIEKDAGAEGRPPKGNGTKDAAVPQRCR
ncbi:unnamed protein product [Pseudo-nitzschia multistriata]|uniref:Uncharacterized protein n=1 Tax=Pseudo-nitzschia multistriata TaxID=183589 RepID=A0A448Z3G2_9STRA|nr:unnamed protein product [Pseudo-nitzschia multistriata]